MRFLAALLCIVTQALTVKANVEKTIFLAPPPAPVPNADSSLGLPPLRPLSPLLSILPERLPVQFPSEVQPHGLDAWYLLQQLHPGQRHEVRVCWPATQPTDFWLDTFSVSEVFTTPALLASLEQYAQKLQLSPQDNDRPAPSVPLPSTTESVLLLRIQAAAAYYTTNRTLMEHPEPVDLDIILDPFILNIFPQSLGPFAIYASCVAVCAWFLSGYIYRSLLVLAGDWLSKPHTD